MKIDIHNHVIPRQVIDLFGRDSAYGMRLTNGRIICPDGFQFPLAPSFHDPQAKLNELERHGLDAAVLSIAPPAFLYEASSAKAELLCETANDGMADFVSSAPHRFRWTAHVPMQAPLLAAKMLGRAARAGAVGVEIATNIAGSRLDDSAFEPFWAAAQELRLPVMIHPYYNAPHPGLNDWYLQNVIGNPLETMIAACRLICSGVLDRFPKISVILVHGGGHLPYQLGRLRHAISVRQELADSPKDPWFYLGRIKFESLTHDVGALRYLVDRVGAENVFVGTDLPFDMASPTPFADANEAAGAIAARQIAEVNPKTMFRFD